MSYADLADAYQFYSQNEIDILIHNLDGTLNELAFERALKSASSEIDMYLTKRYITPITVIYDSVPEIVKEWACIIAVYKRSRELDLYTEEKRVRYEDTITALKDIARGVASLTDEGKKADDPTTEDDNKGKHSAYLEGDKRVFTRSKMRSL